MATKTKDINFDNLTFESNEKTMSAKGKTAVFFSDITKDNIETSLTIQIIDGKLQISNGVNTLKLTNYSGIKYIKTDYKNTGQMKL